MSDILSAALAGATPDELAGLDMPDAYRAAVVKRDEVDMFEGMDVLGTRTPDAPSTSRRCRCPSSPRTRPTSR